MKRRYRDNSSDDDNDDDDDRKWQESIEIMSKRWKTSLEIGRGL